MNPLEWQNFAVVVGGASAALTGLVFVATSLNRDWIVAQPSLRIAAAQTLILLSTPLWIAAAITAPVDHVWVGSLLVFCAVTTGTLLYVTVSVIHREKQESQFARSLLKAVPGTLTCVFIAGAGVSLIAGVGGGLIWIIPAVVLAIAGGVSNAWLLLIRPEGDTPSRSAQV